MPVRCFLGWQMIHTKSDLDWPLSTLNIFFIFYENAFFRMWIEQSVTARPIFVWYLNTCFSRLRLFWLMYLVVFLQFYAIFDIINGNIFTINCVWQFCFHQKQTNKRQCDLGWSKGFIRIWINSNRSPGRLGGLVPNVDETLSD